MNWQDLKYALAVARSGSLSAAARALGVNQTTVGRRLTRLEAELGVRLFDRIEGRQVPTAMGEIVLRRGGRIEQDMVALEATAGQADSAHAGTVRLTAVQVLVTKFLMPRLPAFFGRHPGIALELVATGGNLNLARREADIAIRLNRPASGNLVVRKIGEMGFAAYLAREDGGDGGGGAPTDALDRLPWLVYDEALGHLPEARWLERKAPRARRVLSASDSLSLLEAAERGLGATVLPCLLGDASPRLRRITGGAPVVTREIWLLTHRELRHVARVRCVLDWIADTVRAEADMLRGKFR